MTKNGVYFGVSVSSLYILFAGFFFQFFNHRIKQKSFTLVQCVTASGVCLLTMRIEYWMKWPTQFGFFSPFDWNASTIELFPKSVCPKWSWNRWNHILWPNQFILNGFLCRRKKIKLVKWRDVHVFFSSFFSFNYLINFGSHSQFAL